jgi:hypothetical protein
MAVNDLIFRREKEQKAGEQYMITSRVLSTVINQLS